MFASIATDSANRLRRAAGAILLALPGFGCLPESSQPVTPVEQAVVDPLLPGLWGAAIDEGALYVHVLQGEGALLDVLVVSHEPDGAGEVDVYRAHVSAVGGKRFANLRAAGEPDPDAVAAAAAPWLLVGYDFPAPDRLEVHFFAEEAVAGAIERGELAGKTDDAGEGLSITITDTSERIASFLAGADAASLFDRSFVFQRMAPPQPLP